MEALRGSGIEEFNTEDHHNQFRNPSIRNSQIGSHSFGLLTERLPIALATITKLKIEGAMSIFDTLQLIDPLKSQLQQLSP